MITSNKLIVIATIYILGIICLSMTSSSLTGNNRSKQVEYDSHKNFVWTRKIASSRGDLILTALLPLHNSRSDDLDACDELYDSGIVVVEAFVFAINEVQRRKLLPENITMGYEIRDTCNSVWISQRHTLDIVLETIERSGYSVNTNSTKKYYAIPNMASPRDNDPGVKVIGVVGAGNSELSIAVNRVLSAFSIPQVGFASTSRYLSDKKRFPSFFRVVPPDGFQVKALVALFKQFSWNYVGLLVSDGDYGRPLAESFKTAAKASGVCIGFEGFVPYRTTRTKANAIARELRSLKTELEIIVVLLPEADIKTMLTAMLDGGLSNKTLIASDSWAKSTQNYDAKFSTILKGTLGFANHNVQVREFEEYFLALKPNTNTWNPWFNETWEQLFDCKLSKPLVNQTTDRPECNLSRQQLTREQFTGFNRVFDTINAVLSFAHGVRNACQGLYKSSTYRPLEHCLPSLNPQKILGKLKELRFPGYYGEEIAFDQNGDVKGKYDLVNIRSNLEAQNVGIWQELKNRQMLQVNVTKIEWCSPQEPEGVCARPCAPGMYQNPLKSDPQCCWICQRCQEGTVSNNSSATSCTSCKEHFMSNSNRTACIVIPVKYLDWKSSWTVSIVVIALIAICALVFVVILFLCYANTPVVKSSNRELSFLLCFGLFVTFLVPFAFAGKPNRTKCTISQIMFCVGSALALSAMLTKTLRIVLVFKTQSQNQRKLLKNKYGIALTLVLTFVELTYCFLWVVISPPGVKILRITSTNRYMICEFNRYWYGGSHLLLVTLSLVCTGLAFKGRRLPKNYNEVKYIMLSMFTFNIVWVVFIGAQYGASLEYDAKINCFAIIISSFMILLLLFGPKVFLILFRPQLNRKEEFQMDARKYAFRHSGMLDTVTRSSGTISVNSQKQGSFSNLHVNPHGVASHDYLRVPYGFSESNRKRAHTFHASSPAASSNSVHHSSQSTMGSQKSQTKCPGDATNPEALRDQATLGKITGPGPDHKHLSVKETIIQRQRRTPLSSERKTETDYLKESQKSHSQFYNGSVSMPNILITNNDFCIDPCVTEVETAGKRSRNNSLKFSPSYREQRKRKAQSTKSSKEAINHDGMKLFGDELKHLTNKVHEDMKISSNNHNENAGTCFSSISQIQILSNCQPLSKNPSENSFSLESCNMDDTLKGAYDCSKETML